MGFGHPRRVHRGAALLAIGVVLAGLAACGGGSVSGPGAKIKIGLVTKSKTNPYFIEMRQAAAAAAARHNAELIALSGKFDGDNEGQVTAMENLISRGVKGILITPSNGTGTLSTIAAAHQQGILVIALDAPTDPASAVDATFATDNVAAGRLQGAYLKAALGHRDPKVIMLNGTADSTVDDERQRGFLEGFEITRDSPEIIGRANAHGEQNQAEAAMEDLLQRASDVNTVYTINEPTGRGAYEAITARGLTGRVAIGSIDGQCQGVRDVRSGKYVATVMQFPAKMAEDGVAAVTDYARTGRKPSGFTDTGTVLITDKPVPGLASRDTAWGLENCWQ